MKTFFCYFLLFLTICAHKSQCNDEEIKSDCDSAPPVTVTMSDCCSQNLENDPYHYQKCFLEWSKIYGSSNGFLRGAGEQGGPAGCTAECSMNSTGVYHEYKLNKTVALSLKIVPEDSAFYQVTKDAVNYCIDQANSRSEDFTNIQNGFDVVPGQRNCNPISGFALTCINVYIFRHCPDWRDNPGCSELRSYYNDCPLNHYTV